MTDDQSERLFVRAGNALRTSEPRDAVDSDAVAQLVRMHSTERRARRAQRMPWWAVVAAAAAAFAVGIGAGRVYPRGTAADRRVAMRDDARTGIIEFIFVSPAAKNVALVGDFNGWDAAVTPMKRTDGRTTWSVAVRLRPGVHGYAFVVDGVTWMVDPQAPLAADSWFGERKSVVVVPGDQRS